MIRRASCGALRRRRRATSTVVRFLLVRAPAIWAAAICTAAICATASGCGRSGPAGPPTFRAGAIAVNGVVAPAPIYTGAPDSTAMAVYFVVKNTGDQADTLTGVESPSARHAMAHEEMHDGGMMMMMPRSALAMPAHATVAFAPGGLHVMLEGLRSRFMPGDTLAVTLVFARAGRLPLRVPVVRYDQLPAGTDTSR